MTSLSPSWQVAEPGLWHWLSNSWGAALGFHAVSHMGHVGLGDVIFYRHISCLLSHKENSSVGSRGSKSELESQLFRRFGAWPLQTLSSVRGASSSANGAYRLRAGTVVKFQIIFINTGLIPGHRPRPGTICRWAALCTVGVGSLFDCKQLFDMKAASNQEVYSKLPASEIIWEV